MEEIWKDIEEFETHYQISNFGNVRSKDRFIKNNNVFILKKGINRKQSYDSRGYLHITLQKPGLYKTIKIHILVARHFIPNPENKRTVNHKNGIKTDNRVENLEWNTDLENMTHACKNGYFDTNKKIVFQYDLQGNFIREWASTMDIQRFYGFHNSKISYACLKQKENIYNGYKWKYKEK